MGFWSVLSIKDVRTVSGYLIKNVKKIKKETTQKIEKIPRLNNQEGGFDIISCTSSEWLFSRLEYTFEFMTTLSSIC
ncbi:hypothetical protein GCM10023091_00430 [Ravibacter arvi]|uniref:Uncharacterized protein n=1 Tax=Ravibacter arvi TaxID=2051041 RepID=A0ABP8LJ84_9BACT